MTSQFFTFANQLTLLRLALIPFFAVAVLGRRYDWALALLLAAGVSDALDGILARSLCQHTALGAYLDPIADKLLLSTGFVVLAIRGDVPWTLAILVLGRDVVIVAIALVLVLAAGLRPFPSLYGKACTSAQVLAVIAVVAVQVIPGAALVWTKDLLLWLTAALTVLSGVHYAWRVGKMLPEIPSKD